MSVNLADLDLPQSYFDHQGKESYFGGKSPLPVAAGYLVVLGFGAFFSIFTTVLVYVNKYFGTQGDITSEHFK
jgi:urea-proton symporter